MSFRRLFNIAASSLGIAVTAVPTLLTAFAMKAGHKDSLFYTQDRIGQYGKIFKIFKIRTMSTECDPDGQLLPEDQRTGRLAEIVRKLKIDELPQLLNVLMGDMSIVGPRPLSIHTAIAQDPKRQEVLPGLTGLAQLEGMNGSEQDKILERDHEYVDRQSFVLDFIIACRTPWRIYKNFRQPHYNTGKLSKAKPSPSPPPTHPHHNFS